VTKCPVVKGMVSCSLNKANRPPLPLTTPSIRPTRHPIIRPPPCFSPARLSSRRRPTGSWYHRSSSRPASRPAGDTSNFSVLCSNRHRCGFATGAAQSPHRPAMPRFTIRQVCAAMMPWRSGPTRVHPTERTGERAGFPPGALVRFIRDGRFRVRVGWSRCLGTGRPRKGSRSAARD
jgi:hypothetical protein